jgi:hypothetical protein
MEHHPETAASFPAVACHVCGAMIPIVSPVDELGENFDASCEKCGHLANYLIGDLVTVTATAKEGDTAA